MGSAATSSRRPSSCPAWASWSSCRSSSSGCPCPWWRSPGFVSEGAACEPFRPFNRQNPRPHSIRRARFAQTTSRRQVATLSSWTCTGRPQSLARSASHACTGGPRRPARRRMHGASAGACRRRCRRSKTTNSCTWESGRTPRKRTGAASGRLHHALQASRRPRSGACAPGEFPCHGRRGERSGRAFGRCVFTRPGVASRKHRRSGA